MTNNSYPYSHHMKSINILMLMHLPKNSLKKIEKTMQYSKKPIYFNKTTISRRINNGSGGGTAVSKANDAKDLNVDERMKKFSGSAQK